MRLITLAVASLLTACSGGGGGDDSASICRTVGGQLTGECAGCSIENGPAAVDGSTDSAATLLLSPNAEATLRATGAQRVAGVTGVLFDIPSGVTSLQLQITTYRGGVAQQSGTAFLQAGESNTCGNCVFYGDGRRYAGINTSQAYDSVELVLTSTSAALETPFPVFELCTR